ncbi:pantoate--beta-alanine ligase [Desmospora profundinema]|uniref:Pantothenate synthetase n=1 Tax=Desmospora profundinema TaxID=1571184 RepID=A0ABU1II56_9BACL|nr:pantoate--beta-alanine ligase [Desmospora profundinema]MDR6224457.1 pantoate--beta-alanine ligase [Desmospora profundinema]
MEVIYDRDRLRQYRSGVPQPVGFIPTMGSLHEGHLSLIRQARKECKTVIVSIYVNPLQFGPGEDFERYPRDLERDVSLVKEAGADGVFAPTREEMLPRPSITKVTVSGLTDRLCGASRPGHFDGVATVVTKLFHLIQPDRAYFGLKDAQQVAVIQRMVEDLHMPVTIVPCPTLREPDGLAMSSRNVYLSPSERERALILNRSLEEATRRWKTGEWQRGTEAARYLRETITSEPGVELDYAEVLTYPGLEPVESFHKEEFVLAAVAARVGSTRLIDNRIWQGRE